MKKIIIILSIIFIGITNVSSQVSFSEVGNKWYVLNTYPNGTVQDPEFVETTTTIYGNMGDSIINTETWMKIGSTKDSSLAIANYTYLGVTKVVQDYIQFIENGSNSIDTIYDFNLNIGDSVFYSFDQGFLSTYLYVDSIDNVLVGGVNHKRIFFEKSFAPLCCATEEVWIEGLGSLHGPLFPFLPKMLEIESYNEPLDLTCFKQNGVSTWSNPDYSNCYTNIVLGVNNEKRMGETIKLYPNPSSNYLVIESLGQPKSNVTIEIRGITGKLALTQKGVGFEKTTINTAQIPAGVYVVTVKAKTKTIAIQKWVKVD